MTTQRDPSSRREDAQVRIVSHRLQVTGNAQTRLAQARTHATAHRPAAKPIGDAPRRNSELRQVVLVDRDVDALRDVAVALRDQFDFHVTISGNEALTLLQSGAIDTIVVGQTLYSSTGLSVLAEAKRRAPNTQRVLLANAVEATDIDRDGEPAKPFRLLQRPCTPQKLLDLLESHDEPPPLVERVELRRVEPKAPPQREPAQSLRHTPPVYHGEYEHVVLETPPEPRRRAQRSASVSAEHLPIVVYTDDGDFYQAVCTALQDQHDIRLATQLERAVEMAEIGQCPILITDRAGTQTELQRISIAVRAGEPSLVTIAAGSPSEGLALRKLLNTPALHSFLPKPLSAPLVRLTVQSAMRHYLAAKSPSPPQIEEPIDKPERKPALRTGAHPVYRPLQTFEDSFERPRIDIRRWLPHVGIAMALAAIAVAGGWYWQSRTQAASELAMLVDAELQSAERAYRAGDLIAPENANALYFYRRVLERDPADARASQGLDNIAERLVEQIERHLIDDNIDAASRALATLREVRPGHKRVAFLESQINKANAYRQARQLPAPNAAPREPERPSAVARNNDARASESNQLISNNSQRALAVTRWLASARQRMAQGRLIAPENDSAEYYLRLAERADPNNLAIDSTLRELGGKLLDETEAALAREQLDAARRFLDEAQRFGVDAERVTRLKGSIDSAANANARANLLRLALQRTRDNALFEPPQDNAKFYLGQLQRIDANGSETQQALRAIALKLLDNANQATAQRQFNTAVRLIDEARRLGFAGPELATAESQLDLARSPPAPAPVTKTPPPRVVKSVAARFPDDAKAAGVSGWVDVTFRIAANGDVYDVAAIASNPPGPYAAKFERSAVNAISQYKFEPRPSAEPELQKVRVQFRLQ